MLEGIDSSGKKTQAKKLVESLKEDGKRVKYADFPTYNKTKFGKLLSRFLRGEFGDRDKVKLENIAMLFALDRYQFKDRYQNFLEEGGIIVANRYTQSNIAFQTAELEGEKWEEMVEWILNLEKRIPQPDQVFVLNIDPKKARDLMDQKSLRGYLNGDKMDINEEKLDYQEKVANNYLKLAEKLGWEVVECIKGGELRGIDDINKELWRKARRKIK